MRLVKGLSVFALATMLPLAACSGDPGEDPGVDCTTAMYNTHTFVVDTAQLPSSVAEAGMLALDLDMSDPPRTDNVLGQIIAQLAAQAGLDVTTAVGDAIQGGDVILLASLETEDLAQSACARMGVFLGDNPGTEPCDVDDNCGLHLDGVTTFDLAAASPTDTYIQGQVLGGKFSLGPQHMPGNFVIQIDIADLGMPLDLNLIGARIEVDVAADSLTSGIIGGAITEDDLNNGILPAIEGLVDEVVAADCTPGGMPCCVEDSAGATVVGLFDTDMSCDVSLQEIQESDLIGALLAPDLDLLNGANYEPNVDGIDDSLSIGLGFTATTGEFTLP